MARAHRSFLFHTVDVFTATMFAGNQLAVFPDARGISDDEMQAIAREFNFSEVTFVLPATRADCIRRVRIFTPAKELPFAGHPTVGTAHVLAAIGVIPLEGNAAHIRFEEGVGPVPVAIRAEGGRPSFCQLSVAKLPEVRPVTLGRAAIAELLSLREADIATSPFGVEAVSCGVPYMLVPLVSRDAVRRAAVRMDRFEALLRASWASEILVFAMEGERAGSDIRARMFAPGINIAEDPATGSACAALGGYLAAHHSKGDGTFRWIVEQGFEMGRPSILDVEADRRAGVVAAVRVGGASVMVTEGRLTLPADRSSS
ncbi:MAG: PhzF family phenazine biosynthesis protein [Gemmatimonadaceae bacterium]